MNGINDNFSIDDIIKQAEEIRKKTAERGQAALNNIQSGDNDADSKDESSDKAKERTAVIDSDKIRKKAFSRQSPDDTGKEKTKFVTLEQKTAVIPKTDGSKRSFFKGTPHERIYSKSPPETIEKPATIKSKTKFSDNSDLEEIPTIVAVEELDHANVNFNKFGYFKEESQNYYSDESDQIVLDGFEDSTDKIEKIDEELAEKQLKQRRQDKINKFRLFSPENIGEAQFSTVKNEYQKDDDKTAFLEKLFASKSSFSFKASLSFAAAVMLFLLTVFKDSAYIPDFLLDYTAYFVTQLVIFIFVLIVNFKNIVFGFKFKRGINYSFPVSVVSVIVLIHSVLLAVDSDLYIDGGIAFALVTAFAFVMTNLGKRMMISRIIENFEFLVNLDDKYAIETIVNSVDAEIISRGVLTGDANLKTGIKTDFLNNFLDISGSDEPADTIAKTIGTINIVLSAALFIVISVIKDNWYLGFNAGVCAACISLPVISIFHTNSALLGISRIIKGNGAMINGYRGASFVNNANAVVMEAQNLFSKNSCVIHGIKTFNGSKADDVILKTAAVMTKTKSPLSNVFDSVIIGKQAILPDVDDIVYEDRLGTSAWIYKKKVLVGTRELLRHHGVQVPTTEFEQSYTIRGRKVLYLADAGKLCAMFVVSYNADPTLKRWLKRLEKSGITILLKSCDPYINDESLCRMFSLPEGFIRVMNASNAKVFDKYSDMCVEKSPAYAVHNGTALGFVCAMAAAENIDETKKLLKVLISFGSFMGFALAAFLGIVDGITQLDAFNIVVFQLAWCIFVEIVSKIKRLGL